MTSSRGRSSGALAGSQVVGAALPLKGRTRERGLPSRGDLGEVGNEKRRGRGRRMLGIGVAGQRRNEGIVSGEIKRFIVAVVAVKMGMGMRWDLLDGSNVMRLLRQRSSAEASVAEAATAEEGNDFFELGDGSVGGGAAVGREIDWGLRGGR